MESETHYNKTRYNNAYNKMKYDSLRIVTTKGNKEIFQRYCKDKGISLNSLVNNLLRERLEDDGYRLINKKNVV